MATASDLQQLYVGYFGRAADQEGLNFWLGAINNDGLSLANVHASFVNSEEYNAQYVNLSVSQKVAAVYQNVLGRAADAAGQAFWTNAIETGVISEDQLIEGLLSGLSPKDALTVSNKVIVANYYTSVKGDSYTDADKVDSSVILAAVNDTTASVAAALEKVGERADDVSNSDLAAALAALEAAEKAQLAYARALLDDEEGTVDEAADKVAEDLADAREALKINESDSEALANLKIKEAQDAAAKAVSDARLELAATSGLPALFTKFTAQLAAYKQAVEAQIAAKTEQDAELAKFNVVKGGTPVEIVDGGLVSGVIVKDASGQLVLTAAYTGNATDTSAAQKAAAEALLADIKAYQAASKTAVDADKALDATGKQIADAGADKYDAVNNEITEGPAAKLQAALDAQAELNKAVTAYNDAKAAKAEWDAVSKDAGDARDAFDTLGYKLIDVGVDDADGTNGVADVFIFSSVKLDGDNIGAAEITADAGDVLFIGSNYKLGVDSDLIKPGIQGGDNSAFEIFFKQTDDGAQVLIENSVFGSSVVANGGEFTTITLTGVNVDQLSFDAQTGLVSIAAAV
ncbi:DUF4214 domain-containing protein [Stutzerimonas stutzeri]|uniref:DUF4214 domain-containing protein n=1 Tax=Stutzerimonas stutzeri TaxID=316 RepID=UPI000DACE234|nr:DUF4214 domain-containing protein [Stutzerimonas stutzeri]RAA03678.1 hypothetical protein DOT40_03995 [Stutzerimonas stutzeri]TGY14175.1 DUF4214 domain-containing protein [Stutzerimonas stutzeri]